MRTCFLIRAFATLARNTKKLPDLQTWNIKIFSLLYYKNVFESDSELLPVSLQAAPAMLITMDGVDKVTSASEITVAMVPYMSGVILVGMVVDLIASELVVDSDSNAKN